MKWLNDVGWPKVALLGFPSLIVILIVTSIFWPDTFERILAWLTGLATLGAEVVRNIFGGSP